MPGIADPHGARVGPDELVDLFSPACVDELGPAAGRAVVLVDLDAGAPHGGWRPGSVPVVVVGVSSGRRGGGRVDGEHCDVVVDGDDEATLDAILERTDQHPLAATALAVLLRASETLSVEHGLAAESAVYSTLQAGPEFAAWRATRPTAIVPPDAAPPVLVDRAGDELLVTLNRPARHNAVSAGLRDALTEALTVAASDPSIAAVRLTGAGRSFSSGGDLDEFGSFPNPATAHVTRLTRSPARLAHLLGDRLEVHLHGACMGAGIELPAFARRVVAAQDVAIALPEVGLGLIPGAGGTVSLPRRIGRQRTALLALSGRTIGAATALAWGLVDEVV